MGQHPTESKAQGVPTSLQLWKADAVWVFCGFHRELWDLELELQKYISDLGYFQLKSLVEFSRVSLGQVVSQCWMENSEGWQLISTGGGGFQ